VREPDIGERQQATLMAEWATPTDQFLDLK